MLALPTILGTIRQDDFAWLDIAIWSGVLIVVALLGLAAILIAKSALKPSDEAVDGFTLHGLRRMRAEGMLTADEFERAKASLIARIKEAATNSVGESPIRGAPEHSDKADDSVGTERLTSHDRDEDDAADRVET